MVRVLPVVDPAAFLLRQRVERLYAIGRAKRKPDGRLKAQTEQREGLRLALEKAASGGLV